MCAASIIAEVAYTFLINNARREVLEEAQLMMANAKSVRDYTADEVAPLLEQGLQGQQLFPRKRCPHSALWRHFSTSTTSIPTTNITKPP